MLYNAMLGQEITKTCSTYVAEEAINFAGKSDLSLMIDRFGHAVSKFDKENIVTNYLNVFSFSVVEFNLMDSGISVTNCTNINGFVHPTICVRFCR